MIQPLFHEQQLEICITLVSLGVDLHTPQVSPWLTAIALTFSH